MCAQPRPDDQAPSRLNRMAAPIAGDGRVENPIHRWAAERAACSTIDGHLSTARSHLDYAIAASAHGEFLRQEEESGGGRGRSVLHSTPEPASLERLRAGLDRVATRFRGVTSRIEVRFTSSAVDIGCEEPRQRIERVLAERARTMAGRFDNAELGPDVLDGLESDLSEFERVLDDYAVLLYLGERSGPTQRSERTGEARFAGGPGGDEALWIREPRRGSSANDFGEPLDNLCQVDQSLQQLDRCIARARGDPPRQKYWRGVERRYREESDQLTRRIGQEAIRLDRR